MPEAVLSSYTEKFFLDLHLGHGPEIRFLKDLSTQGVSKILGAWLSLFQGVLENI